MVNLDHLFTFDFNPDLMRAKTLGISVLRLGTRNANMYPHPGSSSPGRLAFLIWSTCHHIHSSIVDSHNSNVLQLCASPPVFTSPSPGYHQQRLTSAPFRHHRLRHGKRQRTYMPIAFYQTLTKNNPNTQLQAQR